MATDEDIRTSTGVTFCLMDEDHTIGNSIRFMLNQDPRVSFCGYSVPHPSENKVNVRVQTTGAPARQVLREAFTELAGFCQHVMDTFEKATQDFEAQQGRAGGDQGTVVGGSRDEVMEEPGMDDDETLQ